MPQLLRLALSDSLSYDPVNKIGGPFNNFSFTKFKKSHVNSGLSVNEYNTELYQNYQRN
jgi:hypothetical protein